MKLDLKNINIKALLTNRRYLLLAGVVVLLTVVMVLGAILPQAATSVQLYQDIQVQAAKLQTLQSKVAALAQISDLEQADRTKVDQALPSSKPLLQLITAINEVAQQSQVTVSDVQLNPGKISTESASPAGATSGTATGGSAAAVKATLPPRSTGPKTNLSTAESLTVGLKVSGSLVQVNQFIENIEKVAPITDVISIQLTTGSKSISPLASVSGTAASFQATLKLNTYYYTQPISATIEAPLPKIGAKEQALLSNLNGFIFPNFQKQQQLQGGGLQDLFGLEK